MTAPEDDPPLREAADTSIRLHETPDDPDRTGERDAFIVRSAVEKRMYENIARLASL